jgi:hypothetical protein
MDGELMKNLRVRVATSARSWISEPAIKRDATIGDSFAPAETSIQKRQPGLPCGIPILILRRAARNFAGQSNPFAQKWHLDST